MNRSLEQYGFVLAFTVVLTLFASGQQGLSGPPPEIRNHVDALVKAANAGSSQVWEKMAQEHFSPDELKRRSAAERKEVFDNIRRDFGNISLGFVEGPEEPLRLHIKGSTGANGIIELYLEHDAPYRIRELAVKMGGSGGDRSQLNVEPPPVNGNMPSEQLAGALDTYFSRLTAKDVSNAPASCIRHILQQAHGEGCVFG